MQRPYTKKIESVKEFYELRDPAPQRNPSPVQAQPQLMRLETKQEQQTPAFTIPTASAITSKPPKESSSYARYFPPPPPQYTPSPVENPRALHCITIADHIIDCPICSRLYRNYTPIYNTIIGILLIVIIALVIKCVRIPSSRSSNSISSIPPITIPNSSFTNP